MTMSVLWCFAQTVIACSSAEKAEDEPLTVPAAVEQQAALQGRQVQVRGGYKHLSRGDEIAKVTLEDGDASLVCVVDGHYSATFGGLARGEPILVKGTLQEKGGKVVLNDCLRVEAPE